MEPETDLRLELHKELQQLHEAVTELRDERAHPKMIEPMTREFAVEWMTRLGREEKAELRGRKVGVETVMEPPSGSQADLSATRDHARKTNAVLGKTEEIVRDNYRHLRDDFGTSLQCIAEGSEPNFPLQSDRQREKAASPQLPADDLKDREARLKAVDARKWDVQPEPGLRQELQKDLQNLHKALTLYRHHSADPAMTEGMIKVATRPFQEEWVTRLVREENAELRGRRIGVEAAMELQARPQADLSATHNHTLQANALLEKTEEIVRDNYSHLRDDFGKSLQRLEEGREPNFPLQRDPQRELTARPQPDPELLLTLAKARVQALAERERTAQKDMKR